MSDSGLQKKFRLMLLKVGLGINRKNIKGLNLICNLQLELPLSQDIDGLDVLEQLRLRGEFDANEPEKLREILEQLGRKDLSDTVNKEYMKSSVYKEHVKERKKKGVSSLEKKRSTIVPMHIPSMSNGNSNEDTIKGIEKTLESIVDSLTVVLEESKLPKANECIRTMQEKLVNLKELTKGMEKEVFSKRMPRSIPGQEILERSNSLDSKTKRKISKKMQEPHLYAIMPVPASVIAEYHQRMEDKMGSEAHSNTSSGSSIASTESNEETQDVKEQAIDTNPSPRYVTVNMQTDQDKDKVKEGSHISEAPDAEDDHVYDDPNPNRAYVNISILPRDDSAKHQGGDDTHGYINVPSRTTTQSTQ